MTDDLFEEGNLEVTIAKAVLHAVVTAAQKEVLAIMRYTGIQVTIELRCIVPSVQLYEAAKNIREHGFDNSVFLLDYRSEETTGYDERN